MARRRSRHHVDHLLNHDDNDSSEEEQRAAAAAEEDGGNGEDEEQEEEEEQRCSSPPRRRRRRMQQPPPPPPSSSAGAALPRRNAISGGANHDNNDSAPRHHQHPLSEYGDNTSPPCFELCGMQGIRLPMSKYKIRQYMDHRQRLVHALFCLSTELSAQGLGACMAFVYDILLLSHGVGCKFTANNKNMSLKTISFFFDEEIGCFHVYVAVNIGQAITKWVDLGNSLNASFVFIKKTPMDRTPLHVLMGKAFRDATAEVLSRNGNRMHEYVLSRGGPRMSEGYSHNFVDALMASEGPAATTPAAAQQGEPPSHHHHHHSQQQQPMRALPAPPLPSSASSSSFDYSPLFSASQPPPPPHPHDAALAAAPPSRQPSAQPAPPPPPPPPAVGAGGGGGVGPTLPPVSGLAAVPPAYLDFLSGRDLGSASKMRALRAMAWDHFHRLFGGMEILTKVYNTQPCYCIKAGVLLSKAFRRALGRPLGGGGQLPAAFDTSFYNAVITAGTGVDEGSRFAVALKKLCDQHAGLLDIPFSDFIGAIDPLSLLSVVVIELVYREISPPHNTRNRDHGPYPLGRVLCLMIKMMGRLTAWIDLLADAITALMELHPGSLIHQELEAALRQTVQDESRCFRRVDESLTQFAFGYGNNVTRAEFTRRLGHKAHEIRVAFDREQTGGAHTNHALDQTFAPYMLLVKAHPFIVRASIEHPHIVQPAVTVGSVVAYLNSAAGVAGPRHHAPASPPPCSSQQPEEPTSTTTTGQPAAARRD